MTEFCKEAFQISFTIEKILMGISEGKYGDSELSALKRMVKNPTVKPCMKCPHCYDYLFYLELFNKCFTRKISNKELKIELHEWEKVKLTDEVITNYPPDDTEKPHNMKAFHTNNDLIYLDQNLFSEYTKDEKLNLFVEELKNRDIQFVYSPSHIEEIYKIKSKKYYKIRIKAVTDITNNVLCVRGTDEYIFVTEDPEYSIKRIKLYDGTTEALEEHKLVSSKDRALYLKKYEDKNHKSDIGARDNIFFEISKDEFSDLMTYSNSIYYKNIDDFNNIDSITKLINAIYSLSYALDLLSYKIDKKDKKIRSSLHDIEHLIYASHTDNFITEDENLYLRAKQIFKVINSKTSVMNKKEFYKYYTIT